MSTLFFPLTANYSIRYWASGDYYLVLVLAEVLALCSVK